jgi:hypothetical protein
VEFKALDSCTDVDVAGTAVDWLEERASAAAEVSP